MRRRLFVGGALLAAAPLLLVAGVVLALSGDRLPVKSTAEVVPQDVVAFVQARDLGAQLAKARGTESWRDLERSVLLTAVMGEMRRDIEGFEGMLKERAERLGLPPALDTYLKFVGHDLGFGVRVDKETGQPSMVMVYRIDTAALLKDLAVDSPMKLAKVLTDRYFGGEPAPSTSYGGFDVYDAPSGGHYALLRDVFVASDAKDTVLRAIDIANAGGKGSLGQSAKFTAEQAKLPGDALVTAFVDVERIRSAAFLESVGAPMSPRGLAAIDRAFKPFPAIAAALSVPGGDLYQARLAASRGASEVLVDQAAPALSSLAAPDKVVYMSVADIRDGFEAFHASGMCQRLAGTSLWKQVEKMIDEPHRIAELPIPTDLPELPEGLSLRFEKRMGLRVLGGVLDAVFPGALAIAADPPADGTPIPAVTAAFKMPPLLQVLEAIAHISMVENTPEGDRPGEIALRPAGAREVVTFQDVRYGWKEDPTGESGGELVVEGVQPMFSYVRIGDTLVFSTDHDGLVAKAAAELPAAATTHPALAHIPAGAWLTMRMQYDRMGGFFEALGPEAAPAVEMFTKSGMTELSLASYIKDGFTTFETLSWAKVDPNASTWATASFGTPAAPFAGWSMLPESTVLSYAARLEPANLLEILRVSLADDAKRQMDGALREASGALGMDVEKELLPALGADLCLGIAPQSAPEGAIPVPAITLTWSVKDGAVVSKALATFVSQVIPAPPEGASEEELASMPRYSTSTEGEVTLHVIEPPAQEMAQTGGTLKPGYALVGDTLVISSSADALRVAARRAGGYAGSAAFQRAAASVGGEAQQTFMHLDLAGLAGLVGSYAPLIAQAMPASPPAGLEPPPFPEEGGDMDQWERDYQAYQQKVQEHRGVAAKENAVRIREGAASVARWVDFLASGATTKDGVMFGRQVFKLKAGQ